MICIGIFFLLFHSLKKTANQIFSSTFQCSYNLFSKFQYDVGAQYVFEIYDLECKQQLDTFYLGDALRSLNYIPTNELVEKLGGTPKKGEKYITIDDFLPIILQLNNTKDMGNYDVFVECLRLYDRNDDGEIMKHDLENILCNMGKLKKNIMC